MNWTLPAIEHNNKTIMDSFAIAEYLERMFPDKPLLFPLNSAPLARLVQSHFMYHITIPMLPIIMPKQIDFLDEKGGIYFKRTREERFGMAISHDIYKDEKRLDKIWTEIENGIKIVGQMLRDNPQGPFFLGTERSYADLEVAAILEWFRVIDLELFERILEIEPAFKGLYKACRDCI